MEESRRHFLRQSFRAAALTAAGILLLHPVDALAAVLRRYHVVAKGDTLSAIAQRYRVSVTQLKLWNGLTKDLIVPGQRITQGTRKPPSKLVPFPSRSGWADPAWSP